MSEYWLQTLFFLKERERSRGLFLDGGTPASSLAQGKGNWRHTNTLAIYHAEEILSCTPSFVHIFCLCLFHIHTHTHTVKSVILCIYLTALQSQVLNTSIHSRAPWTRPQLRAQLHFASFIRNISTKRVTLLQEVKEATRSRGNEQMLRQTSTGPVCLNFFSSKNSHKSP